MEGRVMLVNENLNKKIKTLTVIEKELRNRVKLMKNATINIKIALHNGDTQALGVVTDRYTARLDEMERMLATMDKILSEIKE
jgi:hypothetical protein